MIDLDKLSFWIGCQLDDIREQYEQTPTQYLYGALKAYGAMSAQLALIEGGCDD